MDDGTSPKWFILHPLLAIAGTVSIPVPAIILRKYKGYWSKKIHGYFFVLSLVLTGASMYFVYVNKALRRKPHLYSWHALGGALVVVGYLCLFSAGLMALDPDFACIGKTNPLRETLKWVHKSGGRVLLVLGYWVCFSGWYKFYQDGAEMRMGLGVAAAASLLTYIDPLISRVSKGVVDNKIQ